MLVRYWQPLREMDTLRRQFDRMFDDLASAADSSDVAWAPAIELDDAGDSLILRAQLPGINKELLDVQVTREAVAIAGEHRQETKAETKRVFRSEFRYGKFRRVVTLPVAIQNERVQAEYQDGILTLTLPKVEEARNKVVKVSLGERTGTDAEAEAN